MKRESARQPVQPKKDEKTATSTRVKDGFDVSPLTVDNVSKYLLPVTQEEVLYLDVGMSPFAKAIGATESMGSFGAAIGTVSYAGFNLFRGEKGSFSVKELGKSALTTGLQVGLEAGITSYIENTLACNRGKSKSYDKIIAGTTAGAILGIPDGLNGIKNGAIKGALYSFGLMALEYMR